MRLQGDITRTIDLGTPEIDEISEKKQTERGDNMKCARDPPGPFVFLSHAVLLHHFQTGIQLEDFETVFTV